MKISLHACLAAILLVGTSASFSSCTKAKDIAGAWEAAPERITVPGAADASSTVTLDFAPATGNARTGQVNISSVITLHQMASTPSASLEQPWEVSVAATASATGTYTFENSEDDDIIIVVDPASITVNVDPSGVTILNNTLTGAESASLDSMTYLVSTHYKTMLIGPVTSQFNQFQKIDDIEIHNHALMSAEVGHKDITLRKVGAN